MKIPQDLVRKSLEHEIEKRNQAAQAKCEARKGALDVKANMYRHEFGRKPVSVAELNWRLHTWLPDRCPTHNARYAFDPNKGKVVEDRALEHPPHAPISVAQDWQRKFIRQGLFPSLPDARQIASTEEFMPDTFAQNVPRTNPPNVKPGDFCLAFLPLHTSVRLAPYLVVGVGGGVVSVVSQYGKRIDDVPAKNTNTYAKDRVAFKRRERRIRGSVMGEAGSLPCDWLRSYDDGVAPCVRSNPEVSTRGGNRQFSIDPS